MIAEFELESDRLSLEADLNFDDLTFSEYTIHYGHKLLITLNGVNPGQGTVHREEINWNEYVYPLDPELIF